MTSASTAVAREHRITYEIIVDCYDDYEIAMGWYCYLGDNLDFPFEAEWFAAHKAKPETVKVVGMATEDECKTDILVEIEYVEDGVSDTFVVPLTTLEAVDTQHKRVTAMEDWHYWLNQGGELIDPDEIDEY